MSDKVEDLQQNLSAFKLQDDSKVSEPFSPPTHRNVGYTIFTNGLLIVNFD